MNFKRFFKSFVFAARGLKAVFKEEINFAFEICFGILVIIFMAFLRFSYQEAAIIILCITIVLSSEVVNSVIEDLCNKIEPKHDEVIGKIKDMSAAFVLLAAAGSFVVGVIIFLNHFGLFY